MKASDVLGLLTVFADVLRLILEAEGQPDARRALLAHKRRLEAEARVKAAAAAQFAARKR